MVYHICREAELDCAMVGNIGYSFARQVAMEPKKIYVAEISSFQLDDIKTFRPDVAILTNITEDHLDRYEYKMENYVDSKFRVALNRCRNLPARHVEGLPGFLEVALARRDDTLKVSVRVINTDIYRTAARVVLQATSIGFGRALADSVINVVSFGGLLRVSGR